MLAAIGCALLHAVQATPAPAQNRILVRFSTPAPVQEVLTSSMETFKSALETSSPSQFDVQIHPNGKLLTPGTEVAALQKGELELHTLSTFEVANQVPELGFLNRAFLFRDYSHLSNVFSGPFGEQIRKQIAAKMNIDVVSTMYLGTRHVNLRTPRDVKGPQDLLGVKLRLPAATEWALIGQTLGITVVPISMGSVYDAIRSGAVEGQDNPLPILLAANLQDVTKQILLTSHLLQPIFVAAGKRFLDKLSGDQRGKLLAAAAVMARDNDTKRLAAERSALDSLRLAGVTLARIDVSAFRTNAANVYANAEYARPWDRKLMENIMAVR